MWWESAERSSDLDRTLGLINSMDRAAWPDEVLAALFDFPERRLAAYGTLMPGESNHGLMANVEGTWSDGTVEGVRFITNGYPAFERRPGAQHVRVSVLTSPALPANWDRLDDFEGTDYRRILVPVRLPNGTNLVAQLYAYIGSRPHSA